MTRFLGAILFLLLTAAPASAQVPSLESLIPAGDASAAGRIIQLILVITVLSVAPGLLIMVTCFTRFVVALSFLRAGLGLQTTPANLILISLSLFMTFYVMAPTFDQAWSTGVKPLMNNEITQGVAVERISAPFRDFMVRNVREKDFDLFADLAEFRAAVVDGRKCDRVQHPIGHVGGAGYLQEMAAGMAGRLVSHCALRWRRPQFGEERAPRQAEAAQGSRRLARSIPARRRRREGCIGVSA